MFDVSWSFRHLAIKKKTAGPSRSSSNKVFSFQLCSIQSKETSRGKRLHLSALISVLQERAVNYG